MQHMAFWNAAASSFRVAKEKEWTMRLKQAPQSIVQWSVWQFLQIVYITHPKNPGDMREKRVQGWSELEVVGFCEMLSCEWHGQQNHGRTVIMAACTGPTKK